MEKKSLFKFFKNYYFFLLLALILFHTLNNFIILKNDQSYPYHNIGKLIKNSQMIYHSIKEGSILVNFEDFNYPLLFFVIPTFFYFIFGFSLLVNAMTNTLFLCILVFSVYGIGNKLYSKRYGLLAAFIVSFFPAIFGFSRVYTQDFALTSAVSLCIYCLLRTEYFTDKKFSSLFGLSLGFAAAIKLSFFIYLMGPFLICSYHSFFFNYKLVNKNLVIRKMKNIFLSLIIGFFFASIWYIPAFKNIISQMWSMITFGQGKSSVFGLEEALFYLKLMAGTQILIFFFFLFFLAIFSLLFLSKKKNFLLFSWFLIPLIFYTFFVLFNKGSRFTLPILPAVALMIAIFVLDIKTKLIRQGLVVLIVLVSFGQFFLLCYFPNNYFIINDLNHKFGLDRYPNSYFIQEKYGLFPPRIGDVGLFHSIKYDWGINEIVKSINNSWNGDKTRFIQVETFNQIISMPLKYFFEINGYNNVRVKDSEHTSPYEPFGNPDFVILTNMTELAEVTSRDYLENINAAIKKFKDRTDYQMIANLTLPDDTVMYIYKKI